MTGSTSATPAQPGTAAADGGAPAKLLGEVIDGRYRLDEQLGSGGMGVVFRAHHLALERDVAVKFIRPDLEHEPVVKERFIREAKSASRLDHPHCIRVNDFGETEDGLRYLVMELLRGRELRELIGAPWRPKRAVDLVIQVLEGLAHAHGHGVVHRDLKPANVLITKDHRGDPMAKIVDFGIARMLDAAGPKPTLPPGGGRLPLSTSGNLGTPRYMSPEQATGRPVDARTDLYAVGVLLYELLTGHPPFDAADGREIVRMHLETPPPPLPESVPAALRDLVEQLLAKSVDDRVGSAREALESLRAILTDIAAVPEAGDGVEAQPPIQPPPLEVGAVGATLARGVTPAQGLTAVVTIDQEGNDAGSSMVGSRTLPPGQAIASPFAEAADEGLVRTGERPSVKWAEGAKTLLSVPVPEDQLLRSSDGPLPARAPVPKPRPTGGVSPRMWIAAGLGVLVLIAVVVFGLSR